MSTTASLKQAQRFAQLKGTQVIEGAYRITDDGIIFVLESGPKLTFTAEELEGEIAALEKAAAKQQAILNPPAEKQKAKPKNKADNPPAEKQKAKPKNKADNPPAE